MDISNAVVYDIETFPNCFTLNMEFLNKDFNVTWQISEFKNDLNELREWFNWLGANQIPMIGFNNLHFDYPVIHDIFLGKIKTYQEIYQKAMSIIKSEDKRKHNIWASERFTPQIDLFKIHHFDNKARTTSLKALEINMRSESVMDMPLEVGTVLTKQQIEDVLIPYNKHDVKQTKKFTFFSMNAIDFRISLIKDHGNDVLNWADTKIGSKILEKRLGDNVCYDFSTGRKVKRQTVRTKIRLDEIIFPYVKFDKPEFQKISDNMRTKILKPDEFKDLGKDDIPTIVTEGVFKGMKANVGGLDFIYGLGGIHASIKHKKIISNEEWLIRDIDVASLYPSISKVNRLYPDHLGEIFVEEYGKLPEERKLWQKQKGKKCSEANSLKLASNGTYGNTNSVFSVFYDPKMTMTITINGQLLLSMLTEKLIDIPTLKIIQVNTD